MKLYLVERSTASRFVLMTAKALGLTLTTQEVEPLRKDNLTPEYLKLNPTHSIPTLDDDGFVLFDSQAICVYLVEQYGKKDDGFGLYPEELLKRTVVNQLLDLNNGTIIGRMQELFTPIMRGYTTEISEDSRIIIEEIYEFLEGFLHKNKWLAGDAPTLADIAIVATVSSLDLLIEVDGATHPKLEEWFKGCQEMVWYGENVKGLDIVRILVMSRLN